MSVQDRWLARACRPFLWKVFRIEGSLAADNLAKFPQRTGLTVAAFAWLGWRYLGLRWQDATLLALALLTSSTGFIIDSLDRYGLEPEERFPDRPEPAL